LDLTPLLMKVALLGVNWILWVLLILSGISIAIVIEKTFVFLKARMPVVGVSAELQKKLHSGGVEAGKEVLKKYDACPQARIVMAGLEEDSGIKAAIENAMLARQALEKSRLERYLNFLSTLGNNAPFIGLFGTVLGIMGAFYRLHMNISGGTSVVMKDISEALVATAAGLFVAIPAVIFNNIFRQRIKRIMSEVTVLGAVLFNYLETRGAKTAAKGAQK
jgi:biopolymer transport protein ExbB/TolQ